MRHCRLRLLSLVTIATVCAVAQGRAQAPSPAESFLGTWSGTWDGAGTGDIELTLEKDASGALTGKVSVTGEPTYKATFRTLSFDGNKMTATYDFPPDDRAEIVLAGSFEGNSASGTWSLRQKGTDADAASGGWTVAKK